MLEVPAEHRLRGGLAVGLPDLRQDMVVLDPAFRDRTIGDDGDAVTRAVTQSAMLVLLINAAFAYLVFGILFFGLVTKEAK